MVRCPVYRNKLTKEQQLVVVQHTLEAVYLSLSCVPQTYLVFSIFFEEQKSHQALANKVTALGVFNFMITIMYMVEIASCYNNLRPLVLAHHLCAYVASVYPAFFLTTANSKAGSLLSYFITFEALIFVGLVMYRLSPTHPWTRPTIIGGMMLFGLTRPIQFIWIFATLISGWDTLNPVHCIFQMILITIFSILQIFSLTIHWSLIKKCERMANDEHANEKPKSLSVPEGAAARRSATEEIVFYSSDEKEERAETFETSLLPLEHSC